MRITHFIVVAALLSAVAANSDDLNEYENVQKYGDCQVFDQIDAFTDKRIVNLRCKTKDAVMHIAIPSGLTTLTFAIADKTIPNASNKVRVVFRIGTHEAKSGMFDYTTVGKTGQVAYAGIDNWIEELADSDQVIFKFAGNSAKITLTDSARMAADMRARVAVVQAEAQAAQAEADRKYREANPKWEPQTKRD